jgi:CelD/BcsL family acetyltransferase involved in cellulose biosynthesis
MMRTLVAEPQPQLSAPVRPDKVRPAKEGSGGVRYFVELAAARDLPSHALAWEALADAALEPNCFYEPCMLLPAIERFAEPDTLIFALVYRGANAGAAATELCGFFPLERRTKLHGLPVRLLGLWKHLHCFLCTPLVHRQHAAPALKAFLEWAGRDRQGATLVDFDCVHGEGPFAQVLIDVVNELRCLTFPVAAFNRALLVRGADSDTYLRGSGLSASHRRELQRLKRRLGEQGRLETRVLQPGEDATPWIEQFLQLEASGWKGLEQTALAKSRAPQEYFTAVARAAHARGKLMMLGLFLDDRPIALKCNFTAGPGAFAFKIAYDETYEKYSPGVQLELINLAQAHAQAGLEWMDSCAAAEHFMINRLWKERRTIQHVVLSTGGWRGNLLAGLLPLLRALKRCWR